LSQQKQKYKALSILLKLLLVALFAGMIANRLFYQNNIAQLWSEFTNTMNDNKWIYAIACICLVPINWFIEAIKFRLLMSQSAALSLGASFKAILAGISLGIITPARIGEYGGRYLAVKHGQQKHAVLSTFWSSLAQQIVTVIIGLTAIAFLVNQSIGFPQVQSYAMLMAMGFLLFLLIVYFNFGSLVQRVLSISFLQRWRDKLDTFQRFSVNSLASLLFLAFLRYSVYTLQYLLILWFFQVDGIPILHLIAAVSSIFLIQSGIPLPPLVNILARGEIALFIWSFFGLNEIVILLSTFSIWILNLLIPAIIGLVIIINLNIENALGYKETS